jgi:hypothetical protein
MRDRTHYTFAREGRIRRAFFSSTANGALAPPADSRAASPVMDEFSYLSVLLSIIIGLAITEILQGFRQLLLARRHVRSYWPVLVWGFVLLAIATQMWWSSFGLRARHQWTFAMFAVVLLQTALLYMQAGLVFPEFSQPGTTDLRQHYFAQQRWFFSFLSSILIVSVCKDLILGGTLPSPGNLLFHVVFFGVAIAGALIASERFHKVLAIGALLGFAAYIVALFSRLR